MKIHELLQGSNFGGSPMFFDFKNGRQKIWNPIICQNEAVRPWGPWRCWGAAPDFQVSSGKWRFENTKSQKKNTLSFNSPKKSEGKHYSTYFPTLTSDHCFAKQNPFKKKDNPSTGSRFGASRGRWRSGHLGRNDVQKAWHGPSFQVGPCIFPQSRGPILSMEILVVE